MGFKGILYQWKNFGKKPNPDYFAVRPGMGAASGSKGRGPGRGRVSFDPRAWVNQFANLDL
jgi:hypothetical protein